jgi:DNA relaxase NicK
MTTKNTNGKVKMQDENVESAVDWLTITVIADKVREALLEEAQRLIQIWYGQGEIAESWRFKGYQGARYGSFRWGTRRDSDIAMLSGVDAAANWGPFLALAQNVTRIDVQATVYTDKPNLNLAENEYRRILKALAKESLSNRRYTLINNSRGGQTLYVGSRASDQCGRLYDKACQEGLWGEAGKIWRYEVEYKSQRAQSIARALLDADQTGVDTAKSIRHLVWNWYENRHVTPIFSPAGEPLNVDYEAKVTSLEAKIKWLTVGVRPTVKKLIAAGHGDAALAALDLLDD